MRLAVLATLRNRFTIRENDAADDRGEYKKSSQDYKWVSVFGDDIEELYVPLHFVFRGYNPPKFSVRLLALPRLRVACVSDQPRQLKAVAKSSSIEEISIAILGLVPPITIFEALAKLPLLKLRTKCQNKSSRFKCPFQDKTITGASSSTLSETCPLLTSLDVDCHCRRRGNHNIWNVLPSLATLRELAIHWYSVTTGLPAEVIPFLRKLDSVHILGERAMPSFYTALVGSPVTVIDFLSPSTRSWGLAAPQVLDLHKYPRLRSLSLQFVEGAEVAIPALTERLPELTALSLSWTMPPMFAQEPCPYSGRRYGATIPGVMLQAVRAAAKLSELRLASIRIPMKEVVAILQCLGSRLRAFVIPICHQEEAPPDRLESLLLTAATQNSSLREFGVSDFESIHISLQIWREPRARAEKLAKCLGLLRRLAPYVSTYPLEIRLQEIHDRL